jgi:aspartyl-tRNA synthetase
MKDKKQNSEKEIEDNLEKMNYPASEDIYANDKPIINSDIEKIATNDQLNTAKNLKSKTITNNEKLGSDLDVPGSELDDVQENIGSEDEENNYYSEADTK